MEYVHCMQHLDQLLNLSFVLPISDIGRFYILLAAAAYRPRPSNESLVPPSNLLIIGVFIEVVISFASFVHSVVRDDMVLVLVLKKGLGDSTGWHAPSIIVIAFTVHSLDGTTCQVR